MSVLNKSSISLNESNCSRNIGLLNQKHRFLISKVLSIQTLLIGNMDVLKYDLEILILVVADYDLVPTRKWSQLKFRLLTAALNLQIFTREGRLLATHCRNVRGSIIQYSFSFPVLVSNNENIYRLMKKGISGLLNFQKPGVQLPVSVSVSWRSSSNLWFSTWKVKFYFPLPFLNHCTNDPILYMYCGGGHSHVLHIGDASG